MKRTAYNISKSILLTVVSLPLLSAFLLTITCSLTNFVLSCCVPDPSAHTGSHEAPHLHPPTADIGNTSMDYHGHPQKDSKIGHDDKDGDCCNDLTTAFFSVFQVQPPVFLADHPVPVNQLPALGTFLPIFEHDVDQSLVYQGFDTPPKIPILGRCLRILHQSFLN